MRLEVVELMGQLNGLGDLEPDTARDRDLVVAGLQKVQSLPPQIRDFILQELGPLPANLNGLGDLGGWLKNIGKKLKKAVSKAAPILEAAGAIGIPGATLLAKQANKISDKAGSRGPLQPAQADAPSSASLPMATATPAAFTTTPPAGGGA
ncbi:MAG: hypothetical protein E6R03_08355, partial [Hyphomicrobiaceae bacterium]